jgi:2-polyprenyl-6-methoxyphenol hydroxylase-like FAD-dependent oxidoreductase
MTPPLPLIVAGGGIGGLAAAYALGRQGHAVTVLEQASAFGEIGAGIQLGPNIFRMFEHLGLTAAIDQVAFYPHGLAMNDVQTGEQVIRVPLGDAARAAFGHPYGVIYRADLLRVLHDACKSLPCIALRTGATVESFTQNATSVSVRLADGQRLQGAGLVGADGLWSCVGGEKTHLVHYPLRRGELFNLVAVFHSARYDEGWNTFGDTAELNQRFAHAAPQVKELLAKIETWKMWVLCDREPVKNWTDGRITLLGDAAHPMLQYLAQGAGQAIEDAVVLAAALQLANGDVAPAFQRYQEARYLRTARAQLTSRFYGDIYHACGVQRELRNQMFQSGKESAGFAGLGWMYEGIDPDALFG